MVLAALAVGTGRVLAADFYVGGDRASDRNPGTAAEPFATIQAAADVAEAGDTVSVRPGVYRETVVPANSGTPGQPVTFEPDGDAEVTVSGADLVDGDWTVYSGEIHRTALALPLTGYGERITGNSTLLANQVFVGGKMMIEARWPNLVDSGDLLDRADFRPIARDAWIAGEGGANAVLGDAGIPDIPGGWAGGTIWYIGWFIAQTSTIAASPAGQIEFPSTASEQFRDSYYLTGKLGALDAEDEWFHDGSTLYLWAPGGGAPANVEVKRRNYAFDLSGKSNITIKDLHLFAATITTDAASADITLDGLRAKYISHFVTLPAQDVIYSHSDDSGIRLMGRGSVIRNSVIAYSAGHGIVLGADGCVADNNLIHDISYGGTYCCGIFPAPGGARNTITRNTIFRTGRSGIDMVCGNKEIAHNDIYGFGLLNTDLGAIYSARNTDLTGTRIHHNWLHDAANDADHAFPVGAGIYFDQNAKPARIDHNVFWNNHMNDVRLEQAEAPFHRVFNNILASTDARYWFALHSYPGSSPESLNNNIYRAPIDPDRPGSNEMTAATDPKFADAGGGGLRFRLQADSPAIDAGAVVPGVTDGYTGAAPDLGAYEYGGTDWVAGCSLLPTEGLVGWWKLDETPGTAVLDASGNGYNGARVGNPTYQSGRLGDALHLNNTYLTNVHVRMDNVTKVADALRSGYVTFACWAYPDRVPDQDPTNTGEGLVFTGYRGLSWNMSQRFYMGYYAGTGDDRWATSSVHSPGQWYHVAGVVDTSKGTTRIYVNGRHEGTASFPVGATDDGGTTMLLGIGNPGYPSGTYGAFREAFKGRIDDARIYNRALSGAEIAQLASAVAP